MISKDEIDKLISFVGYGRLGAPLWFLGMEESLGPRPSFDDWTPELELKIRSQWPRVVDVRKAHEDLRDHYWERRNYSQVWRFAAQIARGFLEGAEDWQDTNKAHQYVVEKLGRIKGETLLGDIMPLPAARMTDWPYRMLYPGREAYWTQVWPLRKRLWRDLIRSQSPRVVIAYGKGNWVSYRDIFGVDDWHVLVPNRIEISTQFNQAFVLTPFLGQGAVRKADIAELMEWLDFSGAAQSPPGSS